MQGDLYAVGTAPLFGCGVTGDPSNWPSLISNLNLNINIAAIIDALMSNAKSEKHAGKVWTKLMLAY